MHRRPAVPSVRILVVRLKEFVENLKSESRAIPSNELVVFTGFSKLLG